MSGVPDQRFARQSVLAGVGAAGQARIAASRVVVVGAGGLGSAVLPVLAAAGIGTLLVVDDDLVETSNLARQTLHTAADVGRPKVESARDALLPLASGAVETAAARVAAHSADALVNGATVVVDATDSPAARYALDDACAAAGVPLVWGSAVGWIGQAGVADARRGPRWRDLFPVPPADTDLEVCAVAGVLPSLCTTVGGLMATEVLKLVTGAGTSLVGRLLVVDALQATVRSIAYGSADPAAPPETEETRMADDDRIEPAAVQDLLEAGAPVQLLDVREPDEAATASIPGGVLIPLGSLAARAGELDRGRPVIVYCHHGPRSKRAADHLRADGFDVTWMTGGIDAWSRTVDPATPRY